MNRRNFLKLGALFVPAAIAIVEPRRVYSFLWAREPYRWEPMLDARVRANDDYNCDILLDVDGNPRHVKADIGRLIAESFERSIREGRVTRRSIERIWITGTLKV
jgi:hypothetical protein